MCSMKTKESSWVVPVVKDADHPQDLLLTLPEGLLEQCGWSAGDTLIWKDLQNGSWSLTKRTPRKSTRK